MQELLYFLQNEDKKKWIHWFCFFFFKYSYIVFVVVTCASICFWLFSFQPGEINGETSEGPLQTLFFPSRHPVQRSAWIYCPSLWSGWAKCNLAVWTNSFRARKGREGPHDTGPEEFCTLTISIVLYLFIYLSCITFVQFPFIGLFFSDTSASK